VGRIADARQAGAIPLPQAIDLDGQFGNRKNGTTLA